EIHYISKCPIARKDLYFNSVMCKSAEIKRTKNNIKSRCKCKKKNQNYLLKSECVCVCTCAPGWQSRRPNWVSLGEMRSGGEEVRRWLVPWCGGGWRGVARR